MNTRLARITVLGQVYGLFIALFLLVRLVLMYHYPAYFENLSVSDIGQALLFGLRYDVATITLCFIPLVLLFTWPVAWLDRLSVTRKTLTLGVFVVFAGMACLSLGNIAYFGEVQRHQGAEIFRMGGDAGALFDFALKSRLGLTLLWCLAVLIGGALIWYWHKGWASVSEKSQKQGWPINLVIAIALLVFFVLCGRGFVLKGKPIGLIDAYQLPKVEQAQLAINPIYVILKSLHQEEFEPKKWFNFPVQAAAQPSFDQAREGFTTNPVTAVDVPGTYRRFLTSDGRQKNIVVFLLESWSSEYIDSLSGGDYQVTPHFDKIVAQSTRWSAFYAAAQRSIEGIQAVLTSTPVLDGFPVLGFGLEVLKLDPVAKLAKQAGYETLFVRSAKRRSFHMDAVAKYVGFDHYYGQEDVPLTHDYPEARPRFGWDYETFMLYEQKLSSMPSDKPFFGLVFTGTTHEPFANPGKEFQKYTHDRQALGGFLNTLSYADWALGEFMKEAKTKSWYKDTIFIFSADHVLRAKQKTLTAQFKIPFVVFEPGALDAVNPNKKFKGKVVDTIASQYDFMPTLLQMMGGKSSYTAFGRSLVPDMQGTKNKGDSHYAVVTRGHELGFITDQGYERLLPNKVLEQVVFDVSQTPDASENLSRLRQTIKKKLQLSQNLLIANQWVD